MNRPRWEVRDEVHLGLFSFAKFQLGADLDQNIDLLLQRPVLAHILAGTGRVMLITILPLSNTRRDCDSLH